MIIKKQNKSVISLIHNAHTVPVCTTEMLSTCFTAVSTPDLSVNVTKQKLRHCFVIGSIIRRRSHTVPHFSKSGISSSSKTSFGILPQNTCHSNASFTTVHSTANNVYSYHKIYDADLSNVNYVTADVYITPKRMLFHFQQFQQTLVLKQLNLIFYILVEITQLFKQVQL